MANNTTKTIALSMMSIVTLAATTNANAQLVYHTQQNQDIIPLETESRLGSIKGLKNTSNQEKISPLQNLQQQVVLKQQVSAKTNNTNASQLSYNTIPETTQYYTKQADGSLVKVSNPTKIIKTTSSSVKNVLTSNGNQIKRVRIVIPSHDTGNSFIANNPMQYQRITTIVNNQVIPDQVAQANKNNSKSKSNVKPAVTQQKISKSGFIRPVSYKINSKYGSRFHPILKRVQKHTGVDFAAPTGTPIRAVADGVVQYANWRGGYGKMVLLGHSNSWSSLYGHASKLIVKNGQRVKQGQVIAYVGSTGRSTGPHLHFEILKNGERVNPENLIPPHS